MENQLHRTELEKIIDDNQLYKRFRILKVDKAGLQVFWGWDSKNTLKNRLKQFNSSVDSWETAVADRPLWLTALGNRMALFKWKQFILSDTQRQTCRTEVLKVSVQPTHSISNEDVAHCGKLDGNFLRVFPWSGSCLAPSRAQLGCLRSKPWSSKAIRVKLKTALSLRLV